MTALLLLSLLSMQGPAPGDAPQRSIWELVVNSVVKGDILATTDSRSEAWVPVASLEDSGLHDFAGTRQTLFGSEHVQLTTLAAGIVVTFDADEIQMRIEAPAPYLATTVLTVVEGRPPEARFSAPPSAFVNYAVRWEEGEQPSYVGEGVVSIRGHSLSSSLTVDPDGTTIRGLTTFTFDRAGARRRLAIGDVVGRGDLLTSSAFVGGIMIAKDFSLDPYYIPFASPTLTGIATTPSEVELYVNGVVQRQFQVPPGSFQISRLPVIAGLGNTSIVVRDAFGRRTLLTTPYYLTTETFKRGEQDYSYVLGAEREDDEDAVRYGDVVASALHRVGVTDWLTAGAFAEARHHGVVTGGPLLRLRLWRAGLLDYAGGYSQVNAFHGTAHSLSYTFVSKWFSTSAFALSRSRTYASLALGPLERREPLVGRATLDLPLGQRLTIGLSAFRDEDLTLPDGINLDRLLRSGVRGLRDLRDLGVTTPARGVAGRSSIRLLPRVQLSLSVSRVQRTGVRQWEGFAALSTIFGREVTANVAYQVEGKDDATLIGIQRAMLPGTSWGARVDGDTTGNGSARALVEGQNRFGFAAVRYDQEGKTNGTTSAAVASSVVFAGRGLHVAPVIDQSYALVKVEGGPGVRVYSNFQPIGRTNRRGELFVPDLVPYYASSLSIEGTDVPFELALDRTTAEIIPPYRGGALVTFDTRLVRAWTGYLLIEDSGMARVPKYGTLSVALASGQVQSPLNARGMFYFDELPPGRHAATITDDLGECRLELMVPVATALVSDLGTLTCRP